MQSVQKCKITNLVQLTHKYRFNNFQENVIKFYESSSMSSKLKKVVLCKGVTSDNDLQDSYKITLQESGYECDILPTLNFEFVNLDELKSCLTSSQQYSGKLFDIKLTF